MTTAQIIAQMRRIAKVDTSQYSDANAIIDLNTLKDEFWTAILTQIQENYNWERWTSSSVALQSEYTLSAVAYNTAGTKLINGVSINYDGNTYTETGGLIYIPCKRVNPNTLDNDWDYYVENQSDTDPIYYVADNSYFIAPAPRTAVTNGIKLTGIRKIADYTLSTTEADIKLPVDTHQALVYGLVVFGLMNKGVDANLINDAESRWNKKKLEAIQGMKVRVEGPVFMKYPDQLEDDSIIL